MAPQRKASEDVAALLGAFITADDVNQAWPSAMRVAADLIDKRGSALLYGRYSLKKLLGIAYLLGVKDGAICATEIDPEEPEP